MAWFLSRNYWSSLDHDLMASIWENAISILAGNLNSSPSYLITAVSFPSSFYFFELYSGNSYLSDTFIWWFFSHLGVELEVFSGRVLVQKKGKHGTLFVLLPLDAHKIFRTEKRLFYFRIRTIFSRITPRSHLLTKVSSIQ